MYSDIGILSGDEQIPENDLIELHKLWKDPWKIPSLQEVRINEQLGQNFTNQSDAAILAGIDIVKQFPGFHSFLVGPPGPYQSQPDFDLPGLCIFMDIPDYLKKCFKEGDITTIHAIFKYLNKFYARKDATLDNLKWSITDSNAFDDKVFKDFMKYELPEGKFREYLKWSHK